MSTTFEVDAREVRMQLIERIRSDKAFAEALIEDPAIPLANTELGAKISALQDPEVQGYKAKDDIIVVSGCCLVSGY